ncbi:MAG: hypothetical protein ABI901_06540 [Roseiflexaceae bacterium]
MSRTRMAGRGLALAAVTCLAVACGQPSGAAPTAAPATELSSDDRIATRVAEEQAVAATLTVIAQGNQPPAAATNTPATVVEAPPTPTEPPPTPTEPPPPKEPVAYKGVPPDGNFTPNSEMIDNNGVSLGRIQGSLMIADVSNSKDGLPLVKDRLAIRILASFEKEGQPANDGDGIDHVHISIQRDEGDNQDELHSRDETTAAYCSFSGGEPDCELWDFRAHGNQWPNGTPLQNGRYKVSATIFLKDIDFAQPFWFTSFYIEQP